MQVAVGCKSPAHNCPCTIQLQAPVHMHHEWDLLRRPGSPAPDDEASSDEDPEEGSVAYYRRRAMDPVWQLGEAKASITVLEAAYILLQQKREGRVRNNYFER